MKVVFEKDEFKESGVYIENGTIRPFVNKDMSGFLDFVRQERDLYNENKPKDMHHIACLDGDVIEQIRIMNKLPCNPEGFSEALKLAIKSVKNGELKAFQIHGY